MIKIICTNCNQENKFISERDILPECEHCFAVLEQPYTILPCEETDIEVKGLTLIYQITQEKIEITAKEKAILGRENVGNELFSRILSNGKPVISRIHCSIEFIDGKFIIKDENSVNGTYYGLNKQDCSKTPQIIENNGILYIGEEAFLARINIKKESRKEAENKESKENATPVKYRCNDENCSGYESEKKFDVCPVCDASNNIIQIYN